MFGLKHCHLFDGAFLFLESITILLS